MTILKFVTIVLATATFSIQGWGRTPPSDFGGFDEKSSAASVQEKFSVTTVCADKSKLVRTVQLLNAGAPIVRRPQFGIRFAKNNSLMASSEVNAVVGDSIYFCYSEKVAIKFTDATEKRIGTIDVIVDTSITAQKIEDHLDLMYNSEISDLPLFTNTAYKVNFHLNENGINTINSTDSNYQASKDQVYAFFHATSILGEVNMSLGTIRSLWFDYENSIYKRSPSCLTPSVEEFEAQVSKDLSQLNGLFLDKCSQ